MLRANLVTIETVGSGLEKVLATLKTIGFFLTAFSVPRWLSFLCCEVGSDKKNFYACDGMVKFPLFQGKKKKRKREKLQESASGRP